MLIVPLTLQQNAQTTYFDVKIKGVTFQKFSTNESFYPLLCQLQILNYNLRCRICELIIIQNINDSNSWATK